VEVRIIILATVVAVSSALHAQTPSATQVPPEALHQAKVFETSLKAAIEKAAGQLADRAKEVVPDITLSFETDIRVNHAVLQTGVVYFVEVPGIEATRVQLWDLSRRMAQNPRMSNGAGPGLVPPPIVPDPTMMTNPVKEYSDFTRQALVDAMLDNAFSLPLKDGQTLTLVVGVAGGLPTIEISQTPRKLYLTLKSEDLLALRQNRITRDEARTRISESRY
jgi:hypothetical protein